MNILNEIKFKGVCVKLEVKSYFQRQSARSSFVFYVFFNCSSCEEQLYLQILALICNLVACNLISNKMKGLRVTKIWRKLVLREFEASSKQKYVSKECLQKCTFLFTTLLTVPVVRISHILSETYFIFIKVVIKQT